MAKKQFSTLLLTLLTVVFLFAAAQAQLVVLHTNDLHGSSLARLATLVEEIRGKHPHTLLVDGGDLFSGTPLSYFSQGQAEGEAVLALGYDALAIGNHDFDFGQEVLEDSFKKGLPWLSANILRADGTLFAPPFAIKKVGATRVLLVGLTTTQTPTATFAENVAGLQFTDPVSRLQEIMASQQGNYDLCLVLSHLGYEEDLRLARQVPKITAIIGGHSHLPLQQPALANGVLIAQAGSRAQFLGQITIELTPGYPAQGKLLPVAHLPAHPRLLAIEKRYSETVDREMAQIVGSLKGTYSKNEMGAFFCNALLQQSGADAALYNGGGIRAGLEAGPITKGDIFQVEPFGNRLALLEVPGHTLAQVLKITASRPYDCYLGPRLLDPEEKYTLATSDFLASGGSAYAFLSQTKAIISKDLVREILGGYLSEHLFEQAATSF